MAGSRDPRDELEAFLRERLEEAISLLRRGSLRDAVEALDRIIYGVTQYIASSHIRYDHARGFLVENTGRRLDAVIVDYQSLMKNLTEAISIFRDSPITPTVLLDIDKIIEAYSDKNGVYGFSMEVADGDKTSIRIETAPEPLRDILVYNKDYDDGWRSLYLMGYRVSITMDSDMFLSVIPAADYVLYEGHKYPFHTLKIHTRRLKGFILSPVNDWPEYFAKLDIDISSPLAFIYLSRVSTGKLVLNIRPVAMNMLMRTLDAFDDGKVLGSVDERMKAMITDILSSISTYVDRIGLLRDYISSHTITAISRFIRNEMMQGDVKKAATAVLSVAGSVERKIVVPSDVGLNMIWLCIPGQYMDVDGKHVECGSASIKVGGGGGDAVVAIILNSRRDIHSIAKKTPVVEIRRA